MAEQYNNISNEAVKEATGKTWEEWFSLLDAEGAENMSHKEIAALLLDREYLPNTAGWWAHSVTVGYEYAKGRRVKGQTADAGFQVGVQKTIPVNNERLWSFLTSPVGLSIWLGGGIDHLQLTKGAPYQTDNGTVGEVRSFTPGEKLRLTWQPAHWENSSTLQVYLMPNGNKTALRFHQEKLADAKQRSEMKAHWQEVLKKIAAAATGTPGV